ncbi:helix-turn-helix domain-containing protein [Parvibaculaceae bacterium PLY_AMNH_Bact1]|nr:helix-turn-helix domain-containing protein [Parvibaculaceae bacterium PLY_AMNH_Bact1]
MDVLCDAAALWRFDKGEALLTAGQEVDAVIVLAKGSVTNERTWPNGKHMMTAVLRTHWPLKIHAVWDGLEAPYGLTAREKCVAVLIPRSVFLEVVSQDVHLLTQVMNLICNQLRQEVIAVQMKTVFSLRCQLALYLFYHAQTSFHTITTDEMSAETVSMDVTQDEFAAMLGCSRQKVNGLMKTMEREGIIRRHGRLVEIADPLLLMDAMEEDEPLSLELRILIAEQRALILKNRVSSPSDQKP